MAKKPRKDRLTRRLFNDPSGQKNMFEKSYEEEVEENAQVECLGMTFKNDAVRREYFIGKLREKLKDPEFRKIEGFPIGEDEDVLALSDPPYYTACPNPFIEDFIRCYGKPYDPAHDDYHREPFAADVSEGRSGTVYDAHTYHTKVPHKAIMRYILHYTEPGDIVLDAFAGTGMTGIAAALSSNAESEGVIGGVCGERHAIAVDLCPAATFIAAGYMSSICPKEFHRMASELLLAVENEVGWVYRTCDEKGNPEEILYTIWSDVFMCPECSEEINYWEAAYDPKGVGLKEAFQCPHCGACLTKRSVKKKMESVFDPALNKVVSVGKQVPVRVSVKSGTRRYERPVNQHDRELLGRIAKHHISYEYPANRMMNAEGDSPCWGDKWRAGTSSFQYIHELYTRRNLFVLAALYGHSRRIEDTAYRLAILFLISSYNLAHSTKLARVIFKKGGSKPILTGYQSGTLYASSLSVEKNVIHGIRSSKLPAIESLYQLRTRSGLISTQSATDLRVIPRNTVDYVFTDPPFGDNLAYSELNFPSEAWLRVFTASPCEAIVSRYQKKDLAEYGSLMTRSFCEYYRVLKPGRWITVEFHNTRNAVWNAIQEALSRAGFVVVDVRTLNKEQAGFNAINAPGAAKQDLVISAYKPNGGLEDRFKVEAGTEDGAWDFVRTHLKQLPVFVAELGQAETIAERQNFLLFDRMVGFHVQRGVTVPLSAAEFYQGLAQRLTERDGMYFLPDQVAEYDKKRMTVEKVEQLDLFVTDEKSAVQWIRAELTRKPQSYQDVQPTFLQQLHKADHEQLPELSSILEENFLMYDGTGDVPSQIHSYLSTNYHDLRGLPPDSPVLKEKAKNRWYAPDPKKMADLEQLRQRHLLKEFDTYRETRGKLKTFRSEAVRTGFRACWNNGDYKTIVEIGNRLPTDVLQEDGDLLMYYDNASNKLED